MKKRVEEVFRMHGGQLRMNEAIKLGISRYSLYSLRDSGVIEQVSRGIYRLANEEPMSMPDLVTVCSRYPQAVICLISALSFHELTTQIPHAVAIALPRGVKKPTVDWPPVETHYFSGIYYEAGVEEHLIDGVTVRIYDAEKTLVDCFRFRNQIGLDVALEALKIYRRREKYDIGKVTRYARLCKLEKVMMPYLEAIV